MIATERCGAATQGYGFMAWSLEQGLVSRSTQDLLDTRYRAYRAGNVSEEAMCGEMVQMYAGLRDDELRVAAARYVSEFVRERVFAEMAALVARMRKAGIELWAVSSTNRWVIAEGLRDFGIPNRAHSCGRGARGERNYHQRTG